MDQYFLGADLGGTKTRVMIADSGGNLVGFGESGPGNHESVGYEGFRQNLNLATTRALEKAAINPQQISAAGFGIGGYDWPIEVPTDHGCHRHVGAYLPGGVSQR